jgi:hypothetical protein
MKKRAITLVLSALIAVTMLVMPIYADDSYSFTKVKTYSWVCNGMHYHINYHPNHFQVDRLDSDTGEVVSSVPIDLTVKKNEDSNASVAEVKSDSGLVYINVMRWYQNWIYVYDQKTGTASLAQPGANVGVKSGDYFIGSSYTPTDLSPTDYTLYKFTNTGCEKVKMLTSKGAGATYKAGKFYYGTYPLPDRKSYGDTYPDMRKLQIYQINTDGTHKKLLKTVTIKNKDQLVYPEVIRPYSAKVEVGEKMKTVYYSSTDDAGNTLIPDDAYLAYPGRKASDAYTVYKLSPYKGNRLLVAGTLYGYTGRFDNKTRIFKLSKNVKITNAARWDNHYKIMKYKMSLKKLCSAYKKENSKVMHLWITVKHNQITEIMVESSYRL